MTGYNNLPTPEVNKPISELEVHGLDGNFYVLTRKYLEKHKCIWEEERNASGGLERLHLKLPQNTTYRSLQYPGWYLIELPSMGVITWFIDDKGNHISIPYTYL